MDVLITIDTEGDNQWARNSELTIENIGRIPRFQEICDRHGMKPTYLITHEVADSDLGVKVLGPIHERGGCEIGAHLHPWTSPPLTPLTEDDMRYHPFPMEVPRPLLDEKLGSLSDVIERRFGHRPVSHRAGRWGYDVNVARVLMDLGYRVDCSVTPLTTWGHHPGDPNGRGGPDFRGAPIEPYYQSVDDVLKPGDSSLCQLPMTVVWEGGLTRRSKSLQAFCLARAGRGQVARVMRGLGLAEIWFRPRRNVGAKRLYKVYEIARLMGLPYVEMMFHSSELLPGNPYFPTEAAIDRLLQELDVLFGMMVSDGARGETLAGFEARFRASHGG